MSRSGRSVEVQRRGLGLAVVSAGAFGSSGTFATSLLRSGWSPGAAVAVRVLVAAAALTPFALPALRRHLRSAPSGAADPCAGGPCAAAGVGRRRALAGVAAYGLVAVAGCQLCYFEAVQHLDVGTALLLEYSGTLLVVAWTWLRHAQRPQRATVAGAAAAVTGLLVVLHIGGGHLDPVGVLWGLGAAAGLAFYFVVSSRTEGALPPIVVAWGGLGSGGVALLAAGLLGALPLRAATASVVLGHARLPWLVPVLGLSLLAAAFAYSAGIAAARLLGARLSSFLGLAEVLFAVSFAWVLLGQRLSPVQLGGAALVVAGIALVRAGEPDADPVAADALVRAG